MKKMIVFVLGFCYGFGLFSQGQPTTPSWDFDQQLQAYFAAETQRIVKTTENELASIENWAEYKEKARVELLDMLGLHPLPAKTPLQSTITGITEHEDFRVERVHFQASPGLYVTGNLYIPKKVTGRMPGILYVCGHANVKENGISYGAKVHYHHHAAWFARNGYVCLIIDTLQLAEIEGVHHGLYRYDRWWWLSRGYTPAGVEAWFAIRAIDYLVSRPEVDADRIGMTGRSGGGINTWWGVALDDRIKVAVPVAGVTDLTNHVVDGCVEGHCDCMYMVNTYQWDYAKLVVMAAPRPLLIGNSDQDPIFPIDGVFRTYMKARRVYEKLGVEPQIALNTVSGPHMDVQELRIPAFRWFNHHLRGNDDLIEDTAVKFFQPEQLRVFHQLPTDEINTRIDEFFVPQAPPIATVLNDMGWGAASKKWLEAIGRYPFSRNIPAKVERKVVYPSIYGRMDLWELSSDEHTKLPVFRLSAPTPAGRGTKLIVLDDEAWKTWSPILSMAFPAAVFWPDAVSEPTALSTLANLFKAWDEVILLPIRGAGPAKFSGDQTRQTHIRRRYYLLGQTLEEMQTLDIVQALKALTLRKGKVEAEAGGSSAAMLIYASLQTLRALSLNLHHVPKSHHEGPAYLSILRYLDIPAALLMAAERHEVIVRLDKQISNAGIWKDVQGLVEKNSLLNLTFTPE